MLLIKGCEQRANFPASALIFALYASAATSASVATGLVTSTEFGVCIDAGWSAYGKLVRGSFTIEHLGLELRSGSAVRATVKTKGQDQGQDQRSGKGDGIGVGA